MSKTSLKLLSWNINGYRAVWGKGFSGWLTAARPDVLCLQETKAWAEQLAPEQLNPEGYKGIFSRPERKGYSGVATLCLEPPAWIQFGLGVEGFDIEGRVLITEHADLTVANIYFPNGKQSPERLDYKMAFYEETLRVFSRLIENGRKLVVAGDYNTAHKPIDLEHPAANENVSGFLPEEREWIDRWIAAGFVDIFRCFNDKPKQYTWWDQRTRARERNVGWRIDYFFVSENLVERVIDAWITPEVEGSDHCPLGLEVML